jgi:hypothetical protein
MSSSPPGTSWTLGVSDGLEALRRERIVAALSNGPVALRNDLA